MSDIPAKRTSARVMAAKLKTLQVKSHGFKSGGDRLVTLSDGSYHRVSEQTFFDVINPKSAEPTGLLDEVPWNDPTQLHLATADLVDRFAEALKAKLLDAQLKHLERPADAWKQRDWEWWCQTELVHHIRKGDPLDVAAYAAFCWHHGWSTNEQLPLLDMPRDEPFTCGTAHVAAQAVLTLAEPGLRLGNAVDAPMLEKLEELVNEAGLRFALELGRRADDIPF